MRKPKTPSSPNPLHTWLMLFADIILWASLAGIIIFFSPEYQPAIIAFFTILPIAILLLLKFIFVTRRALLLTFFITGLLALRFFQLDQWLNVALLIGLLITIELLFITK